ncbi:DNA alkylation repair protein [Porphyromonas sp.]|uniref:DNA alkylation repair protein n=1 Tax=Porphyromonas sp. TaxID=1924944 RepID=UPI0026DC2C00|nr:DNA alkylation repair protein [Porphyromonas sp.]MDO4695845.1 DNA alkylation repair protein [Porphyromonas sp.]MDO4771436.1 DNA alkylation repair protein [Porphyromonas sp.]
MSEQRKGARRISDVPHDILERLNRGEIATANLTEGLAIDQCYLLRHVLMQLGRESYIAPVMEALSELKKRTFNTFNQAIGETLHALASANDDDDLWSLMSEHPSDTIRCWVVYMLAAREQKIEDNLSDVKRFAADEHFGVREISWLAMRGRIVAALDRSIEILMQWAKDEDENIRRFASEAIRPRGVWCEHIGELKLFPEKALGILELLRSDPSKYVRDSVGNWLNDASKSRPDFVVEVTDRWLEESPTAETHYIVRRALRTIHRSS